MPRLRLLATIAVLMLTALLFTNAAALADRVYFVNDGDLVWRELTSPALHTVGPISDDISDLAFDDDGRLLAFDRDKRLLEIDPESAVVTVITDTEFELTRPLFMFFDSQGRLWVRWIIDIPTFEPASGFALHDPITGMLLSGGFDTGSTRGYFAASGRDAISAGEIVAVSIATFTSPLALVRIDIETGTVGAEVPLVPPLSRPDVLTGGDVDRHGRLIMLRLENTPTSRTAYLIAIDPNTGAVSRLPGDVPYDLSSQIAVLRGATASIPTLDLRGVVVLALLLGTAGLVISRRRSAASF